MRSSDLRGSACTPTPGRSRAAVEVKSVLEKAAISYEPATRAKASSVLCGSRGVGLSGCHPLDGAPGRAPT